MPSVTALPQLPYLTRIPPAFSDLSASPLPVDSSGMQLNGQENRRAVAVAAFRGKHFCGYSIKSDDGTWYAVAQLGMSWSKFTCLSAYDARAWLRMTSHAGRFESYSVRSDLRKAIDALPVYDRPAIEPEAVIGVESLTPIKLGEAAFSRIG